MKKTTRLKILELFGGIGAPRMALENLGIDIKSIDYVEILDFAVLAYNKMFNHDSITQDVEDWNLDVDILIHGSPCQDFSHAGKGAGGEKGSKTRSSLMWDTVDIVENRLNVKPKVVIWENVKAAINKNNKTTFDKYLLALESLGYKNNWKVLNSKDFGIPQSRDRVFVISILKDSKYTFDFNNLETKKLDKKLIDILEPHEKVDDWYYINQPSMGKAIKNKRIKIVDDIAEAITTKQWRWDNDGVAKIPFYNFNAENYVRLPEQAVVAPTITAEGANSRIKIAVPVDEKRKEAATVFIIDNKPYHLRKLTERECWRLMGFNEKTIDNVFHYKPPIPRSKLYFLAGNSIVVQVMEAIFKELLKYE